VRFPDKRNHQTRGYSGAIESGSSQGPIRWWLRAPEYDCARVTLNNLATEFGNHQQQWKLLVDNCLADIENAIKGAKCGWRQLAANSMKK
jgi:hypothetical protein